MEGRDEWKKGEKEREINIEKKELGKHTKKEGEWEGERVGEERERDFKVHQRHESDR